MTVGNRLQILEGWGGGFNIFLTWILDAYNFYDQYKYNRKKNKKP